MTADTLIKVEGVSKKFCRSLKRSLWYGVKDLGNEIRGRRRGGKGELRPDEFWAIEDVSFELKRGECLGLIGRNGAGKTTLMRMLNGLIKPDSGRIEIRGRVGGLIALGAGFNPVLTGRENIYVNASVLGLTKQETESRIEEIIEFAELAPFIDMPVQSYSSGMQVRLGFSIASALKPDILLLDEVLAVGDAAFRAKSYSAINSLISSAAVIFVSHSMPLIARVADSVLVLNGGVSPGRVSTEKGISEYESQMFSTARKARRSGVGCAEFKCIVFNGIEITSTQLHCLTVEFGGELLMHFSIEAADARPVVIDITFHGVSGDAAAECSNYVNRVELAASGDHPTSIEVRVPVMTLNPGVYRISFILTSENMMTHYDWMHDVVQLSVTGRPAIAPLQFIAEWRQS